MRKLLIKDTWEFPEDDEGLIDLVEQHMGSDTADALREIVDNNACGGECDETYKIADHYRRVIREIVNELMELAVYAKHRARLGRIIRQLEAEL